MTRYQHTRYVYVFDAGDGPEPGDCLFTSHEAARLEGENVQGFLHVEEVILELDAPPTPCSLRVVSLD